MKLLKIITLFAILFSVSAFSQNTETEPTNTVVKTIQPEPLFIVKLTNGEATVSQSLLTKIDTNWIESIGVFKNLESEEIQHYGKRAENGLVLIYIKKEYEEEVKKLLPQ